ncbi:MAG TPA: hypothetical protein VFE61_13095 [Candidatus Sulfotelmatobacter sp.]|jgi:hypothetical protein|nr:hypothetical protein [Candidatus Sulfotelmatobacter sp.]
MKTCVFQCVIPTLAVILFAVVYPAEAKVVYTPVGATVSGNGSLQLDLNHDKETDFTVVSYSRSIQCPGQGYGTFGLVTITPTTGNGVVGAWAAAFSSGVSIDSSQSFVGDQALMTQFSTCLYPPHTNYGAWLDVSNRYLGLEFNLNGQIHYGWAEMSVLLKRGRLLTVTLTGFAYETIPGKAIKTGQESGASDDPLAPDSSGIPVAPLQPGNGSNAIRSRPALILVSWGVPEQC